MGDLFMQLTYLQAVGTAFGVAQVLLARENKVHNYLFGIVSILISMWVLYQTRLYADILLNMYYLLMSIYGWFYWKFGKKKEAAPISYSSRTEQLQAIGIVLLCFSLMSY